MVNKINLPKNVELILDRLHEYDYEAYIVGGCVRDSLLGLKPHDWDICTSALPEETSEVFNDYKIIPTGLQHGTITIVIEDELYEVTTFRIDKDYSDGRHPDKVEFVSNLEHDLARRDFTINAIAYNHKVRFVDPFNGITDLHKKILRCVGNPYKRFDEDALRIMRAIRFAAVYDLSIEKTTSQAVKDLAHNLNKISKERITSELLKLLKAKEPGKYLYDFKEITFTIIPEFKICDGFDQNTPWHEFDVFTHITKVIDNISNNFNKETLAIIRFAALFHDIAKPNTYREDSEGIGHFPDHAYVSSIITKEILDKNFRLPTKTSKTILTLIQYHADPIRCEKKSLNKFVSKIGKDNTRYLLELKIADVLSYGNCEKKLEVKKVLEELIKTKELFDTINFSKECTQISDLVVTGDDLRKLGYQGKEIGKILNQLLDLILDEKILNNKKDLLNTIIK